MAELFRNDVFVSRSGREMARVVYVGDGRVHMEHCGKKSGGRRRFNLPLSYFDWEGCGWRLEFREPVGSSASE